MKALAVQAIAKVQFGTNEVHQAFFVAKQANPMFLKTLVFGPGFGFKIHTVAKTGASTAEDRNPQVGLTGLFGVLEQAANLVGGFGGNLNHGSHKIRVTERNRSDALPLFCES